MLRPSVAPPAKVRLFVSEDGGTRWHLDAEVPPSQQRFDFRSLHDGEYWFTIRSIDAQGRSYPDGAYEPQLRVIVDTLAPRLDLSATRGAGSEVTAHWDVVDTAVDPTTFKLEYQITGGAWQTLAIAPSAARRQDDACRRNGLVAAGGERKDRAAGVGRRSGRQSGRQPIPARSRCRTTARAPSGPATAAPRRRSARQLAVRGAEVGPVAGRDDGRHARPRLPGDASTAGRRGSGDSTWRTARSGPPRDSAAPGGRGVTTQTVGRQTPLSDNPAGQFGLLARRRTAANGQSPLL